MPRMGAAETRRALAAAERALPEWKARTAKDRARVLRRLADLMLEHEDDLARLMVIEQGKPLAEARVEVQYAASFYEWFGEEAKRVYGDTIPIAVAGQADPRDEGAGRRHGRDHALELPGGDADPQVRARARGRLHDGAEARGADAALARSRSRRSPRRRAFPPASSRSSPAPPRTRRRSAAR